MPQPPSPTVNAIPNINRYGSDNVVFGMAHYKPGGTCGPRIQSDYQLVLLLSGAARVKVDDKWFTLPLGHVCLMKPKHLETFEFSRSEVTQHSWCAVHPKVLKPSQARALGKTPFCAPISPALRQLIELGLSCPYPQSGSALEFLDGLGLLCLLEFQRTVDASHTGPKYSEPLEKVRRFIGENYSQSVALSTMARTAAVTPHHLIKLFRRHLHTTPARFLWRTRTERGAQMLRETGLSISEIAYRTGFQSPFHFSRLMKQHYEFSPREFRQRSWGLTKKNRKTARA